MASIRKYIDWLFEQEETEFDIDKVIHEPKRAKIPHEKLGLFKNEGYHNILAVLKKATKEEIDYWGNWYLFSSKHVQQLASDYDVPVPVAAAVAAVLSPNLSWKLNLVAARRIMDNWMYLGGAEGYKFWTKNPAYKTNINKALQILETGDIGLVQGPKVSVFFKSLLYPEQVEQDLVLDGHAINVWRGIKVPLKSLRQPTIEERKAIIEDYKKVANVVGLSPQAIQAITWFIWKSVKAPPTIKGKFSVKQPREKTMLAASMVRLGNMIKEIIKETIKENLRRH